MAGGRDCRRTLDYFVDNYGQTGTAVDHDGDPIPNVTDETVTALVDTRELWFVCVSNPDGYEFTFTPGNRLWRKNMRDNDNNGVWALGDGVDPNRNFATNWGLDEEGASDNPASETYRGPGPDSEPETTAMKGLQDRVDFAFQKNDHTAAELLLWPNGFQQYTPTPDNAVFEALAGDDAEPAIADKSSTRTTRCGTSPATGSTRTCRRSSTSRTATRSTTRTTTSACSVSPPRAPADNPDVSGFEFPDDEDGIEAEFQRHLLFALDLAQTAADPGAVLARGTLRPTSTSTRSRSRGAIRRPCRRRSGARSARSAALPHQRRRGAHGATRMDRRRALRQGPRRLLPPRPRRRHGHQAGRRRAGVVRAGGRTQASAASPTAR